MKNMVKTVLIKLAFGLLACTQMATIYPAARARKAPKSKKVVVEGGGVLVYAFNPKDRKYYVLLGKEKSGPDKEKWSDFGGGAKPIDRNDPIRTAAREFEEESEGIFGKFNYQKRLKKHGIRLARVGGYYSYALKMEYNHDINKIFPAKHEMTKVRWIPLKRLIYAVEHNVDTIGPRGNRDSMRLRHCRLAVLRRRKVLQRLNALR